MPMKDGTRVMGVDDDGCVLFESNGLVNHTCETPAEFVEWYGLDEMDDDERRAIGIEVH
jgi:hypothetical protein